MLVVMYAKANGTDVMPETLRLTCDVCGKPFSSLEAAFLGYARPQRRGERIPPRQVHKKCAEQQPPPDGGREHLWRLDHALYSLIKGLLRPAEIPRALRKDLPDARRPWGSP